MVINDVELEFDLLDIETFEKYEEVKEKISTIDKEIKDMTPVESMKYQCTIIFDIFNDLFGEGTDKKIFGNRTNYGKCLDALVMLIEEEARQSKEIENKYKKYSVNRLKR